jgi:hypothetical protein
MKLRELAGACRPRFEGSYRNAAIDGGEMTLWVMNRPPGHVSVWSAYVHRTDFGTPRNCCREALCDAPYRLAKLEASELRMVEVEWLILVGVPMGLGPAMRIGSSI